MKILISIYKNYRLTRFSFVLEAFVNILRIYSISMGERLKPFVPIRVKVRLRWFGAGLAKL